MNFPAHDDAAEPDQRLRVVAEQLGAMIQTGEITAADDDARRALAMLPMLLRDIVVEVYATRAPAARVVRLRPALILSCRMLGEGKRTEPLDCGEPVCAGICGCFAITNGHGSMASCHSA